MTAARRSRRAREDRPDLILMDLFMPGIDGVEATRQIMSESPCAILLVTATVSGHLDKVYEAMGHGALDAIDTPTFGLRGEIAGTQLLLNKIELIGKLIGKPTEPSPDRCDAAISPPPSAVASLPDACAPWSHCPGSLDRGPSRLGRAPFRSARDDSTPGSSSSSTSTRRSPRVWGNGFPNKQAGTSR